MPFLQEPSNLSALSPPVPPQLWQTPAFAAGVLPRHPAPLHVACLQVLPPTRGTHLQAPLLPGCPGVGGASGDSGWDVVGVCEFVQCFDGVFLKHLGP